MIINNGNNNKYEEGDKMNNKMDLIIEAAATAAIATGLCAMEYAQPFYNKTWYYDSALLGITWVMELLAGHPECICKELGVHKHVFHALINTLKAAEY